MLSSKILNQALNIIKSGKHLQIPLQSLSTASINHAKKRSSTKYGQENETKSKSGSVSDMFTAVNYKGHSEGGTDGELYVGPLYKKELQVVLNKFYLDPAMKTLAAENGIDYKIFSTSIVKFRAYITQTNPLPTALHIAIKDIIEGHRHHDTLFPHFYQYVLGIFPHLTCMEELLRVSDLTNPSHWYPEAREMKRRIIFHAGSTNSGKTYTAMKSFLEAGSGIYCSPLKMLAAEVSVKSLNLKVPCDLTTGDEKTYAFDELNPAKHLSCTIEMASLVEEYDVAVIDEIQMIQDPQRGWAWTRALLGLKAKEIHLCGEAATIDLVEKILDSVAEPFEVRTYERKSKLSIEKKALGSLENVEPGDCIVCFSKRQIQEIVQGLDDLGKEVAVIYGGLPSSTKVAQANKFNDPNHPCNIMVATDAIGMGINLSIRRIVFYGLEKKSRNDDGELESQRISVSQALQIAGRAGRFNTHYSEGFVTCYKNSDMPILELLLSTVPTPAAQAGIQPTVDQIEKFCEHLSYSLTRLLDIFTKLSTLDSSSYFLCAMREFKFLAELTSHISLDLRSRYIFCSAPVSNDTVLPCKVFVKFMTMHAADEVITADWVLSQITWPPKAPTTFAELNAREGDFEILELYLWLGYRFPSTFPDRTLIREAQNTLSEIISGSLSVISTQMSQNPTKPPPKLLTRIKNEKPEKSKKSNPKKNPTNISRNNHKNPKNTEKLFFEDTTSKRKLKRKSI